MHTCMSAEVFALYDIDSSENFKICLYFCVLEYLILTLATFTFSLFLNVICLECLLVKYQLKTTITREFVMPNQTSFCFIFLYLKIVIFTGN